MLLSIPSLMLTLFSDRVERRILKPFERRETHLYRSNRKEVIERGLPLARLLSIGVGALFGSVQEYPVEGVKKLGFRCPQIRDRRVPPEEGRIMLA